MLLFLLFILPTVICGQQPYQDGKRRSRQLDLGLQEFNNEEKSKNVPTNILNNGYLPPISAKLSPKVVAAQSQQTFETVQNTLCNPSLDSIFCPKSKSEEEFPKPSRHLVPPFNDIEKVPTKTTKAKLIITTTTAAATTKKSIQTTSEAVIVKKIKELVNKGESTNEIRSYLPPQQEYSGAAQTSVGVIRPPDQNIDHHDHDHHHHHHHHNGNICDDAFHSFLCAPLKARKRITGALPNSLKGSSSFVQYQKVSPNPHKVPASSNIFQNEYLPPSTTTVSSTPSPTIIRTTFAPSQNTQKRIVTTTTPQSSTLIVPQSSNENDRFYLPPVINNKAFAPVQPEPSNQLVEKLHLSSTTQASTTYTTPKLVTRIMTTTKPYTSTLKPIMVSNIIPEASFSSIKTDNTLFSTFAPLQFNEDRSYLPPKPKPQPAASFIPTTKFYPSTTKLSSLSSSLQTVSTLVPSSPNTIFSSPQPKIQLLPVIPSQIKSQAIPITPVQPKVVLQSLPVIPLQPKIESLPVIPVQLKAQPLPLIPLQPKIEPLPVIPKQPKVQSLSSIPLQPRIEPLPVFPVQSKIQPLPIVVSTTVAPIGLSTTVKPVTLAPTYVPPVSSVVVHTKVPARPATTYAPKTISSKYQAASNLISTTIKPFTTTQRPTTKFAPASSSPNAAYLPSDLNYQPAAAQINSEAVIPPRVTNPFHHGRDLCTDPFHSFLCAASKPRKRITGALPAGYKSDSSNVNVQVKPAPSFQSENRIKPEKPLETSQSLNVGYSYPKQINPFPSQSNSIPTSTAPTTTGYSYPKPEKIFPLPSQQQEFIRVTTTKKPSSPPILLTSEAKAVTGYSYPKPEISFPPSTVVTTSRPGTTGYDYPKPQKPFSLTTEQKEVVASSPKPSSIIPQSTNEVKGYQYPKPQQSFNLPDNKGYFYPKPERKLDLPTEVKPKSLFPQTNSNPNIFGNSESAEFIPVNKLDKRDDSKILSGLKRFGERMRILERRH